MTDERVDVECCGGLIAVRGRVDAIEQWRDDHVTEQLGTTKRLFDKFDSLSTDLARRWPQSATVLVTVLAGLLGTVFGALIAVLLKLS